MRLASPTFMYLWDGKTEKPVSIMAELPNLSFNKVELGNLRDNLAGIGSSNSCFFFVQQLLWYN
jgi:hypothetical protein